MVRYALLIAPSANRVYADASPRLARAELGIFADTVLGAQLTGIEDEGIAGIPYITFSSPRDLDARQIAYLSNLSSIYALFRLERGGPGDGRTNGDLLRPVMLAPLARFDDDLLTIQKYAGKTNEQFTKLLLNVTMLAAPRAAGAMLDGHLTVLDPLAGRGTTLNQALMYGHDAIGIDTDGKDFDLYAAFIRTWLKRKRIKHHAEITPVRREKRTVARRLSVTIGGDLSLTAYHADTTQARDFLKERVADVIVADLPYGVQHGSTAGPNLSRRPLDLLRAATPVWARLLRPGGALGMSWNTHVAAREDAAEVIAGSGLAVQEQGGYAALEHWVDQSITRDVLVATKP